MRKLRQFADKIALGVCVVLFLAAAVWATLSFRRLDEIAALNPALSGEPVKLNSVAVQIPEIVRDFWPEPPNQSRGSDWVYDVFTPPVLYYDPTTREFTVTRPELNPTVVAKAETPFEIELVAVKQEEYRIQLVGYQGKDGDYAGLFEIVDAGKAIVLGRSGGAFPEAQGNFTVRSFEVRRVTTPSNDSMPVVEDVGFATIVDGRTGREVALRTGERLMMPRLQCVVRTRTYPPEEHALREGMKITVNGYDYLIVQLSLNPAQAVVSRRPPNSIGGAETRTLVPVGNTAATGGEGAAIGAPRFFRAWTEGGTEAGTPSELRSRHAHPAGSGLATVTAAPPGPMTHRGGEIPLRPRDISIDSPLVSLFPNLPRWTDRLPH